MSCEKISIHTVDVRCRWIVSTSAASVMCNGFAYKIQFLCCTLFSSLMMATTRGSNVVERKSLLVLCEFYYCIWTDMVKVKTGLSLFGVLFLSIFLQLPTRTNWVTILHLNCPSPLHCHGNLLYNLRLCTVPAEETTVIAQSLVFKHCSFAIIAEFRHPDRIDMGLWSASRCWIARGSPMAFCHVCRYSGHFNFLLPSCGPS